MTALDGGNDALCCFQVTDGSSRVVVIINASPTEALDVDVAAALAAGDLPCSGMQVLGTVGGAAAQETTVTLPPVSCMLLRLE